MNLRTITTHGSSWRWSFAIWNCCNLYPKAFFVSLRGLFYSWFPRGKVVVLPGLQDLDLPWSYGNRCSHAVLLFVVLMVWKKRLKRLVINRNSTWSLLHLCVSLLKSVEAVTQTSRVGNLFDCMWPGQAANAYSMALPSPECYLLGRCPAWTKLFFVCWTQWPQDCAVRSICPRTEAQDVKSHLKHLEIVNEVEFIFFKTFFRPFRKDIERFCPERRECQASGTPSWPWELWGAAKGMWGRSTYTCNLNTRTDRHTHTNTG